MVTSTTEMKFVLICAEFSQLINLDTGNSLRSSSAGAVHEGEQLGQEICGRTTTTNSNNGVLLVGVMTTILVVTVVVLIVTVLGLFPDLLDLMIILHNQILDRTA